MAIIVTFKDSYPLNYLHWLKGAGLEPIAIDRIRPIKKQVEGVVFTGGGDLNPWFYTSTYPACRADSVRDVFEYRIFTRYVGVPMLGICRGAQLLNVFLGGTLKNIDSDLHRGEGDVFHPMLIKNYVCCVNSAHHQAINALAPCLTAVGTWDNVIELARGENYILCQYHPERLKDAYIKGVFKKMIEVNKK